MTVGVRILGDRLWQNQAAVNRTDDKSSLPLILIESWQHVPQHRYHRQKLVLIWWAMPHFAEELRGGGCQVTYTTSGDFEAPLKAWIQAHNITEVRVSERSTFFTARSKLATPLQNNPNSQQSIPLDRNRIQRLAVKSQTFVNGRLLSSHPPAFPSFNGWP
jgi:deoxyribodipyrimidine photolyase-like uncharacterized protein